MQDRPIIIKKYKKKRHATHGGSWKIAYADFITSMMALFLLMWLISITTEDSRKAISEYFTTSVINMKSANAGTGMINGNSSISQNGNNDDEELKEDPNNQRNSYNSNVVIQSNQHIQQISPHVSTNTHTTNKEPLGTIDEDTHEAYLKKTQEKEHPKDVEEASKKTAEIIKQNQQETHKNIQEITKAVEAIKQVQQETRKNIEDSIKRAFNSLEEVEKFKHNLIIELTDEGIKIQIVDSNDQEMFKTGSAVPLKFTEKIIRSLGEILATIPNKIEITGHTDSSPYRRKKRYGNWELSADRANSTRRLLEECGVSNDRFDEVNGRADKNLLNKEKPTSPENRRVSITILYNSLEEDETEAKPQKNHNTSAPKIIL